jgi:glycosyltransferase involved in cell wall biosynthesis
MIGTTRPKVCHVISGLGTGGAEQMLYKLLAATQDQHLDNSVISLSRSGTSIGAQIKAIGVDVLELRLDKGPIALNSMLGLRGWLNKTRPQLLQGWMYHGNLATTMLAAASRRTWPVVWNIRQTLYDLRREKTLTRWVIRAGRRCSDRPNRIIYNSALSKQQHEQFGYVANSAGVVPNGFEVSQFNIDASLRRNGRARLGVADSEFLIGLVARFHPMKDHDSFFRAAAQIAKVWPGARFLLVGAGCTSDNQQLIRSATLASVLPRTLLLGEQHDMAKIYPMLDLLCLSSAWGEGFPNVLGEAMLCGVDCVATDIGDCQEILAEHGEIVLPSNPRLRRVESVGRLAGAAARSSIVARYSMQAIAQQYIEVYRSCLAKHSD